MQDCAIYLSPPAMKLRLEKQQEELMIGAAVILGLLTAVAIFAFLYIKFS